MTDRPDGYEEIKYMTKCTRKTKTKTMKKDMTQANKHIMECSLG
jgi:hypothetical protein